jgi:endonuclease YncB( thermonuclease family)
VSARELAGRVVSIQDGDTLTVLVSRRQIKVRLADIDAPERKQPFGTRSRQSLADLCAGKDARIAEQGRDRYGRTLGRVTCASVDANAEQVRRGMAWVYERYAPKGSPLYVVQTEARAARRGLWQDARPVPPWEWRRAKR